jgi:ADP-ribose pyrophosphatase
MSVKINSINNIYQNRVFRLDRENVTLENDVTVNIDLIRHPGAAAMVAMSDDGKVILLQQYRHAIGDYIWEIPAGTLETDENPLECAKRELIEESGFSAINWQKLGEITPVPGYSDERIHLFLATGLSPAEQNLDQGEILNVHHLDFGEAISMIHEQKIQDAKTICGLMLAQKIYMRG